MTPHPLIGDLTEFSIEELQEKLSELNKKLSFAYRMGNQQMVNQLRMIMESYSGQYQAKLAEQHKKMNLQGKINISSDN